MILILSTLFVKKIFNLIPATMGDSPKWKNPIYDNDKIVKLGADPNFESNIYYAT